MRVFISHSHDEAWVAGRMRAELDELGVTAFTYETNVETGQEIFGEIKKHLRDCDDFVILLTPTSVKSPWVLVELGGALVLNKRVIAFHMYVKPEEIPAPIPPVMRRHINDTKSYYDELVKRLKTANFVSEKQEKVQEQAPELRPAADSLTDELAESDVQKLAGDPAGKAAQMTEIVRRLLVTRPVLPPPKPPAKTSAKKRTRRKKE